MKAFLFFILLWSRMAYCGLDISPHLVLPSKSSLANFPNPYSVLTNADVVYCRYEKLGHDDSELIFAVDLSENYFFRGGNLFCADLRHLRSLVEQAIAPQLEGVCRRALPEFLHRARVAWLKRVARKRFGNEGEYQWNTLFMYPQPEEMDSSRANQLNLFWRIKLQFKSAELARRTKDGTVWGARLMIGGVPCQNPPLMLISPETGQIIFTPDHQSPEEGWFVPELLRMNGNTATIR